MDVVQCIVVHFPENYRLSGFVCVHIRRSNSYLSHVYMDLYCGEFYYSWLLFVPIYVSVCVGELFAICVCQVTGLSVRVIVLF